MRINNKLDITDCQWFIGNQHPSFPEHNRQKYKRGTSKTPQTQKFCILVYYNLKNSQILEQKKK